MFRSIFLAAVVVVFAVHTSDGQDYQRVNLNIKNTSAYTIKVTIAGGKGKPQTYTVAPGKQISPPQEVYFYAGPYTQGSQGFTVTTEYNGNRRSSFLPIYLYNGPFLYSAGEVYRHSPGVLGLRNVGNYNLK